MGQHDSRSVSVGAGISRHAQMMVRRVHRGVHTTMLVGVLTVVLALKTEPSKRTDAQKGELAKIFNDTNDTPVKQVEKTIAAKKKARSPPCATTTSG